MRILLTNDDGIDAPGLAALRRALEGLGEIVVVAPAKVQSATSHAVTFHRPIAVEQRPEGLAVHGRPADCVKLALHVLFPGQPPFDLVVSGMNSGANVGVNVLYSGTVGAAREATFHGIPAIAVSLHLGQREPDHWDRAAGHARHAIDRILAQPMDGGTLFNLNIPVLDDGAEPRGLRVCRASLSHMDIEYEKSTNSNGHTTYCVRNAMRFARDETGSDVEALFERYVTVTPLHFDTTCAARTAAWAQHLHD